MLSSGPVSWAPRPVGTVRSRPVSLHGGGAVTQDWNRIVPQKFQVPVIFNGGFRFNHCIGVLPLRLGKLGLPWLISITTTNGVVRAEVLRICGTRLLLRVVRIAYCRASNL